MDGPKLPFVMKSSISLLIYADTFRHQSMMRHEITTKIHGLPTVVHSPGEISTRTKLLAP